MARKVCPVVSRIANGVVQVLAFRHPLAGKQFVKGSIEPFEAAPHAALRELSEESGIIDVSGLVDAGEAPIGPDMWHFFDVKTRGLPDDWMHKTEDDFGHVFAFFWHPIAEDLDDDWDYQFHEALAAMRRLMPHLWIAQ